MQVNELCEAANKEVGQEEGVKIANFLCNGNYAVSGGLLGCEVSCSMLLASPVQMMCPCQHCSAFPYPLKEAHSHVCDLLVSGYCTFFDSATKTNHGHLQAVEKMAKDFKARMTVRLAVAGAFHTDFMKPAEEKLRCAPLTVDAKPPAPQL